MSVKSINKWQTNGHLIADCAELGYLRSEWRTLDPTYGYGTFWKVWRPVDLTACDLDPMKSEHGSIDFTNLPWGDKHFDAVVFDPPYKLLRSFLLGALGGLSVLVGLVAAVAIGSKLADHYEDLLERMESA